MGVPECRLHNVAPLFTLVKIENSFGYARTIGEAKTCTFTIVHDVESLIPDLLDDDPPNPLTKTG